MPWVTTFWIVATSVVNLVIIELVLNLSKLLNENGYIKVNKKLATSIKGVYAIGDCLNKDIYQLITAASDGAIVINNIEKTK